MNEEDKEGVVLITINDVRKAGHCVRGLRDWFDKQGLDFRDFVKNGILSSALRKDGLANQIIYWKKKREKMLENR